MDRAQWNQTLMGGLVKQYGSPGDPLYLYVDGEVLAELAHLEDPDEAIDDFTRAFRATTFKSELNKAVSWQTNGFEGDPPFLTALAMTVLAVTLDPLSSNGFNVYRRQRQLLGYEDLDEGRPPGYEHVPDLWRIWNQWLGSAGAGYGLATAETKPWLRYQGWARSQAFLRHKDKQDIYRFFQDHGNDITDATGGEKLVTLLNAWLREQGSNSRLARLAGDRAVSEELAVVLKSSFKYWTGERTAAKQPLHLQARALWDPSEEQLDLVAPLTGVAGVVGKTVRDFDGAEWELDSPTPYAPFSSVTTNAGSWLSEPVLDWQFAEDWWVSWNPPEDGVFFFVPDSLGLEWLSTPVPESTSLVRVLVANTEWESVRERVCGQPSGCGADVVVGQRDSVAEGYSWLTLDNAVEFTAGSVCPLLPLPAASSQRNHRLIGGLKLQDRSYLIGFEPDLQFTFHPSGPKPEVVVDGQKIDAFEGVHISNETEYLIGTYPLTMEFLDPGEHTVTVTVGDHQNTTRLRVSGSSAPALEAPRSRRSKSDLTHFSFRRAKEPLLIMVTGRGDVMRLTLDDTPRSWVAMLEEATGASAPERYFDSSWLDWARSVPARREEDLLLAARPDADTAWDVFHVLGDPHTLLAPPRVSSFLDATAWEIVQLFGRGASRNYADGAAEALFAEHERKFARDLTAIQRSPTATRRRNGVQQPEPRKDLDSHVIADNPLDSFLCWLTELGDKGALFSTAEAALAWLWKRRFNEDALDFRENLRRLEALGHVRREGGRVVAQEPSVTWLPDSEALAVLAGRRSTDTLNLLDCGYGAPHPDQDDALADTVPHVYTQQRKNSRGGADALRLRSARTGIIGM